MPLVKVGSLSTLPPGSVLQAVANGESYAICNVDGEIHALEGTCPHAGGPLGEGALHGSTLVCPWHSWEYDCVTGENTMDPDTKLAKYAVTLRGDDILVDLP
jgi:nitrite reductase (NADH) small subunit